MAPNPLFYQLLLVALVLICLILPIGWPDPRRPAPQTTGIALLNAFADAGVPLRGVSPYIALLLDHPETYRKGIPSRLTYTRFMCMMLSMAPSPAHEELSVNRRINVSLPEETLKLLDRVAPKGDRSRLIDEAVRHYVEGVSRAGLRKRLKEGAVRRAARDLALAEEWFPLEEELWHNQGA